MERIDSRTITTLLQERDNKNPNEFLLLKNKIISEFNISCKNICFKNCTFDDDRGGLFSDCKLENVVFDSCIWVDSIVQNAIFKNIIFKNSVIYNNVGFKGCVFNNLNFDNSLLATFGFEDCKIINTDFRNKEYFFLQSTSQSFIAQLCKSGKLNNVTNIVQQNKDKFVLPWYGLEYHNCIINLASIKRLATYSERIDPNYSHLAGSTNKTGFIRLQNCNPKTKLNIIAGMFLYDADQTYEYSGTINNEDFAEYNNLIREKYKPLIFGGDEIDITKYKKTLVAKPKKYPITIVDNLARKVNPNLILPIGQITFTSSISSSSFQFVESHFDASLLDNVFSRAEHLDEDIAKTF